MNFLSFVVTCLGVDTEHELIYEAGDRLLVTSASSSAAGTEFKARENLLLAWHARGSFVVD